MIDGRHIRPRDMGIRGEQLTTVNDKKHLMPLPAPFEDPASWPEIEEAKPEWRDTYYADLDGFIALDDFKRPQTKEEEDELVNKFLKGLEKLLNDEANKGMIQVLDLTMEYCAKCNTCSDACHLFVATDRNEIYRPTYRIDVLRRIIKGYINPPKGKLGRWKAKFTGADVDLNWETIMRLAESAYRCNLCRRCAQACPLALDNGSLAKEIRKIFSQEMDIAPKPVHNRGAKIQLQTGSSTGITRAAFLDTVEFLDEDLNELYPGNNYEVPIDKKGADILLIHNAGEYMAWPENPMAFEILFNEAGLSWTLSSDMIGYDNVNYGIWYDDKMARDIALQQIEAAKKLGVNRIVVGECGHAHKAISVVSDRFSPAKDRVPVESFLPMLRDLVLGGAYDLDPMRNDFAVTLHDPCNFVRQMGVVQPQRDIINAVVPKGRFMEMYPHGVDNYCCGGGSGFAIMNSMNFPAYRENISTRMKLKQVLDAFGPENIYNKDLVKYICAPCSNCKGTFREMLKYWGLTENYNFQYAGLVELVVNAMTKFDTPYFEWMRDDADEFSMM